MNDKGIREPNLPFWYNVNANESILKVSSLNCKCYANMPLNVGFEKDVELNIDVECKGSTSIKSNGYTCILQNIIKIGNNNANDNESMILYTFLTIRYIDMSETTDDDTYCNRFCGYINEHRDVFKNEVLVSRSHKCKIVDILTDTIFWNLWKNEK